LGNLVAKVPKGDGRPVLVISPLGRGDACTTVVQEFLTVKIGAKIVRHDRSITFQMAEVMVPRGLFKQILSAIAALRPLPPARC
jgi:hypothetical protein